MNNYIVECRNKTAFDKVKTPAGKLPSGYVAGEWSTNLQEKITLEEGDQILVRNSYIDTKAEAQQKIIIPDGGINILMEYIYYDTNYNGAEREFVGGKDWRTTNTSPTTPINVSDNINVARTTGKNYIACNKNTVGSNMRYQDKLTFQGQNAFQGVGGFFVCARYTDANGDVRNQIFELPSYFEFGFGTEDTMPLDIIYDNSKIPTGNTDPLEIYATKIVNNQEVIDETRRLDGTDTVIDDTKILPLTGATTLAGDVYAPVTGTTQIFLPAGNYDPVELCTAINELTTKVGDAEPTGSNIIDNQLLLGLNQNVNDDKNNFIEARSRGNDPAEAYGYVFTGGANPPLILGASQFTLSFDTDTNRFQFDFLHTPIYAQADNSTGGEVEVGGLGTASGWTAQDPDNPSANPTNLGQTSFHVSKNGGIAFTNLQPASFWKDQLGFDLDKFTRDEKTDKLTNIPNPNSILVGYQVLAKNDRGTAFSTNQQASSVPVLHFPLKDGVNTTSGFMGVSTLFKTGNTYQQAIQLGTPNVDGKTLSQFETIGETTNGIRAGAGMLSAIAGKTGFGYFLIEVEAQYGGNNYINPTGNFRHVSAIVSRYYQAESYVSSTSADSIIYTHTGTPMLLNSFKCRILDSNKNIAENIGEDNTVIIEVVKAPKVPKAIKDNK